MFKQPPLNIIKSLAVQKYIQGLTSVEESTTLQQAQVVDFLSSVPLYIASYALNYITLKRWENKR